MGGPPSLSCSRRLSFMCILDACIVMALFEYVLRSDFSVYRKRAVITSRQPVFRILSVTSARKSPRDASVPLRIRATFVKTLIRLFGDG